MILQRGFTLWELLVVIALVIILFVSAIENLLPLRGEAERAAHAYTVGALRSAVGMHATQRASARRELTEMAGANPVEWLSAPPGKYIGTVKPGEYQRVPRGGWGFDADNGMLFYRFRYPEYVHGDFMSPPGVRYRVEVAQRAGGSPGNIGLRQLDWFEWRTDGSELERWMKRP